MKSREYDVSNILNHHAYYMVGKDSAYERLIESLGIFATGQDFTQKEYDIFTILDSRELKESAGIKPIDAKGKRIFVISMNGITIEAQNSLLKLLEEPSPYVHIFLIIPSAHLLIPTIKSRLSFVDFDNENVSSKDDTESMNIARKFMKSSIPKRLEFLKDLLDDIAKEKKNKQDAIDFLDDLERVVYEDFGAKKGMKMLQSIRLARKYANDRAPSFKMLLEYVALV